MTPERPESAAPRPVEPSNTGAVELGEKIHEDLQSARDELATIRRLIQEELAEEEAFEHERRRSGR